MGETIGPLFLIKNWDEIYTCEVLNTETKQNFATHTDLSVEITNPEKHSKT